MAEQLGADETQIFRLFVNMNKLKTNTTEVSERYQEQQEQYKTLFEDGNWETDLFQTVKNHCHFHKDDNKNWLNKKRIESSSLPVFNQ